MQHYKACQRAKSLKWDFCNVGEKSYPVGYCRPYREFDGSTRVSDEERERYAATAHKHHGDGHDTAQEAADCYAEYLLDHYLRFFEGSKSSQRKCAVCGDWTSQIAHTNTAMWHVCSKHANRESVATLLKLTGNTELFIG